MNKTILKSKNVLKSKLFVSNQIFKVISQLMWILTKSFPFNIFLDCKIVLFIFYLPVDNEKGLIEIVLFWADNICSNYTKLHQEVIYLKSVSGMNAFLLSFIDKFVQKFLKKLFVKRTKPEYCSEKKRTLYFLRILR